MPLRVVCLIPARNAAADLPACLASAALVCDDIIALDDGSVDRTRTVLEAHPLVRRVLTNSVRGSYAAWDDAANRNRLLEAAAAFAPDWILSLDADERIDPADAAALRAFLETDAIPGCAYGFQHIAMRGDAAHCLPRFQWIYRCFSWAPGQRFPGQKLHFIPVPTAIPRALWFRTTIRIQHYGSATPERRMARFEKYAEADPERRFQADYAHLLHDPAPSELVRWRPRPPDLPVLVGQLAEPEPTEADAIALSAIVIAQRDAAAIARTVGSVVGQVCPEPFEVIVVVSGSPETAAVVRRDFPAVRLIELDQPVLPGAARNAGLAVARGEFVSFPGSHVELPPGSLAARLAAHRRGYAMVTGVAVNGTSTRAGWASYFLDHHEGLPGHGPSVIAGAPAHCSYARQPLLEAGGFPEDRRTGEDTAVNRRLAARGYVALRDPAIVFVHRSPCRTPWRLARHHFHRGRGWGRLQLDAHRQRGHLLTRVQIKRRLLRHLPARLARIEATAAAAESDLTERWTEARGLIRLGAIAAWAGMWTEILRPGPGKLAVLFGRPVQTLGVIWPAGAPAIALLRIDQVARRIERAAIPPGLPVVDLDGREIPLGAALGLGAELRSLPELRDLLQHALDLDLDGVIVARGGWPLAPEEIVAALSDDDLARTLARLGRFRHAPWLTADAGEAALREALGAWRDEAIAPAPAPTVWLP